MLVYFKNASSSQSRFSLSALIRVASCETDGAEYVAVLEASIDTLAADFETCVHSAADAALMYGSVLLSAGLYRVNPLDYLPLDIHYGTPRLVQ